MSKNMVKMAMMVFVQAKQKVLQLGLFSAWKWHFLDPSFRKKPSEALGMRPPTSKIWSSTSLAHTSAVHMDMAPHHPHESALKHPGRNHGGCRE